MAKAIFFTFLIPRDKSRGKKLIVTTEKKKYIFPRPSGRGYKNHATAGFSH